MSSSGRRRAWWSHRTSEKGTLVSEKGKLKREMEALFRREMGREPTPRQLKRWAKEKNRELPRTDVLRSGGRVA